VLIVLDDPASTGQSFTEGRGLLLGLDGARRATDRAGRETPPVLLTVENRSVLAYDIVPDLPRDDGRPAKPVTVTVASEANWSLAGVLGSDALAARAAAALVGARGLEAALRPAVARNLTVAARPSLLRWSGPQRTVDQRRMALARSRGSEPAPPPRALRLSAPASSPAATKKKSKKSKGGR
jgi:hypothetical protein